MGGDKKRAGGLDISRGSLSDLSLRDQREGDPLAVFASYPIRDIAFHVQPAGAVFVGTHRFSDR